jgi:hypothetical protein
LGLGQLVVDIGVQVGGADLRIILQHRVLR